MSAAPPRFSAIVVSYFTGPILTACLEALLKDPLCGQIILVNNGNPDDLLADLKSRYSGDAKLTLIHGHGNIGFGAGCNLGAAQACAAGLVFVNPDCVIDLATLSEFARVLEQFPDAIVGGALRNDNGSEQRGGRRGELTLWSAFVSFAGLGRPGEAAGLWRDFNRNREPMPSDVIDMPVVSGALMGMNASVFKAISGFNPSYFLHVEDIDLCDRVRESGRRILFAPQATALHIGGTSQASSWRVERAKIASFAHYFWTRAHTFGQKLGALIVIPLMAGGVLARLVMRRKAS
jgi:N-acetylglucosaminyl-diphospho-decaprenol L-rhamnosyltransferase